MPVYLCMSPASDTKALFQPSLPPSHNSNLKPFPSFPPFTSPLSLFLSLSLLLNYLSRLWEMPPSCLGSLVLPQAREMRCVRGCARVCVCMCAYLFVCERVRTRNTCECVRTLHTMQKRTSSPLLV